MADRESANSFGTRATLKTPAREVQYFRLDALATEGFGDLDRLPISIRVLLENLLRHEDGRSVTRDHVAAMAAYDPRKPPVLEIPYKPSRVLLQDFTGVPAVVDLAAMRSAMHRLGGDPDRINPEIPVDLVIDHSVQVDAFAHADALQKNAALELERNRERYEFLRWGQKAFDNFGVVPPENGICHQVNLEHLASVVTTGQINGQTVAFPDTLVGTDSHTTMVNGLGVLGWGVGGIEAEAAMLGQPIFMLAPPVVGFRLTGELPHGATATDLVLTITQQLRNHGVVGMFVEFFGPALGSLALTDRATIANMAPEYGATMGFFPVDDRTLDYLRVTGRSGDLVDLVERYSKAQGLWSAPGGSESQYQDVLELDLSTVEPSLAGPSRPQDRVALSDLQTSFRASLSAPREKRGLGVSSADRKRTVSVSLDNGERVDLNHGAVVIAAITSCTNTSNPSVMLGAGLLAQKAAAAGLKTKPWVKTSLAPGSRVVTDYLDRAGLTSSLEALGFHTVGYGCTTCIGNSGPLPEPVQQGIELSNLVAASVLSGNRNFEGRISPYVRASYLASPPLVVAYALAGTVDLDLTTDPLGTGSDGQPVYLADIWPSAEEVATLVDKALDPATFRKRYNSISDSNENWNAIEASDEQLFPWSADSTYIQHPPFFAEMTLQTTPIAPIESARVLVLAGDSITTDHISPAGAIPDDSPAAQYLQQAKIPRAQWNTFGSRRGNDRIMTRGTFGNIRLKNLLAPGTEGGWTTHFPGSQVISIYEAAARYKEAGVPTVVLAGKDYGMGSSRDWAAKGTFLLGVRAVMAESYERIHRSNLVGMGVLPLQFPAGESAESLGLEGRETFTIHVNDDLQPGQDVPVEVTAKDGTSRTLTLRCRIDTPIEIDYYRNGGILHTVLRGFLKEERGRS
jgi:aconitate hydratase A / 2-methylisocitrate dehydratase